MKYIIQISTSRAVNDGTPQTEPVVVIIETIDLVQACMIFRQTQTTFEKMGLRTFNLTSTDIDSFAVQCPAGIMVYDLKKLQS